MNILVHTVKAYSAIKTIDLQKECLYGLMYVTSIDNFAFYDDIYKSGVIQHYLQVKNKISQNNCEESRQIMYVIMVPFISLLGNFSCQQQSIYSHYLIKLKVHEIAFEMIQEYFNENKYEEVHAVKISFWILTNLCLDRGKELVDILANHKVLSQTIEIFNRPLLVGSMQVEIALFLNVLVDGRYEKTVTLILNANIIDILFMRLQKANMHKIIEIVLEILTSIIKFGEMLFLSGLQDRNVIVEKLEGMGGFDLLEKLSLETTNEHIPLIVGNIIHNFKPKRFDIGSRMNID